MASAEVSDTATISSEKSSMSQRFLAKIRPRSSHTGLDKESDDMSVKDASARLFWPRDLLPLQCPEARVLVLGYDTIVARHQFAGATNQNSVFTHSKNLVFDLSRSREMGKPILFVVHSLGGIVVKEVSFPVKLPPSGD